MLAREVQNKSQALQIFIQNDITLVAGVSWTQYVSSAHAYWRFHNTVIVTKNRKKKKEK